MKKNRKNTEQKNLEAYTLLELVVVIAIIAILATGASLMLLNKPNDARVAKASTDLAVLASALDLYSLDNGSYPTTEQGITALVEEPTIDPMPRNWQKGGYIKGGKKNLKDPWGNQYVYRKPGNDGKAYDLYSYGADGKEGGADYDADIYSE